MKKIFFTFFLIFQVTIALSQPATLEGYIRKRDDKTGKLLYEGMFKNGKPTGKFKYYYPNDSIRAVMIFKIDGSAYAKLFHENGKRMSEGRYINKETKDSVWTFYDEVGVLISREQYINGKKEGRSIVYLPDGSITQDRNYKADKMHGPFKEYFTSGAVKSAGNYADGELEGRVAYYYPNGIEVAAGFFRSGRKNGAWIYRHEDGTVKEKELYVQGKKAGPNETEQFFLKNKVNDTKPLTPVKPKVPAAKKKKAPAK